MADDHSQQENFIPLREGLLRGQSHLEIVAKHFGIPVASIREISVWDDPCHFGLFVLTLRVRLDG